MTLGLIKFVLIDLQLNAIEKKGVGMKNLLVLLSLAFVVSAKPTIAVVDFETNNYGTAQKARIITDLFRNELVRSGKADIVDRNNIQRVKNELKFQMSDYADPARMKQFGKMVGADNLIIGNFEMLGSNLHLVVKMLDVETAILVYSSQMSITSWDEYEHKIKPLANEFIKKFETMPQNTAALMARFIGTWTANVEYEGGWDTYEIEFQANNRAVVRITGSSAAKPTFLVDGGEEDNAVIQETNGSFSFADNVFKLNAAFRNPKLPHIRNISWSSVASFNSSNTAFNILIRPNPNSKQQVRITFTKM